MFWPDKAFLLNNLKVNCCQENDFETVKVLFEKDCDKLLAGESQKYKLLFSSVSGDFLEIVPHLHKDGTLAENDLYFNAFNPHICDICGDEIEPGEPAFFRTDPSPAIRHRNCSHSARFTHEYAFIEYLVKEIAYHEQVFRFNECCDYKLHETPGISLKQHRKNGYLINHDGSVMRIPRFGEFVMDFISGTEDYDLIRKYRPYHVYIEFMLKTLGFDDEIIESLNGFKYLLRENISREIFPDITERIDNITLSELMFDKHIHKLVSKEITDIIYRAVFRKIFQTMGILNDDNTINLNGITQTYSVNEECSEADISVIIDKSDIYCVDFEKSLPFDQYFSDLSDEVNRLLDYCKQFGVDT